MSDRQRVAALLLDQLGRSGFVLSGAGAIREHALTDRPTHDIDLFAHSTLTTDQFAAALARAQQVLTDGGFQVDLAQSHPLFARLHVGNDAGDAVGVDVAVNWRAHLGQPPSRAAIRQLMGSNRRAKPSQLHGSVRVTAFGSLLGRPGQNALPPIGFSGSAVDIGERPSGDRRRHRGDNRTELHGAGGTGTEVLYLQPWPDNQPDDPHERVVARETIELAFIVAVQHLPARQRAVLILRDVLGWPAQQTADTLELTVASANSALQRARGTMREHLPRGRLDWSTKAGQGLTEDERRLVAAYVRAHQRLDIEGLSTLLREDLRFAMPPQPGTWVGRDQTVQAWLDGGFGRGEYVDWECRVTLANGQPAVAAYLRRPGSSTYQALAMDVLRVEDGVIAEITTFGSEVFEWFNLPRELEAEAEEVSC